MVKKLLTFGVAIVMQFSVVGLTACTDKELAQYKTDAKAEITSYVATLSADDYTNEKWLLIEQKATEGKTAVDAAESKSAVDTAKAAAITKINWISSKEDEMDGFKLTISTTKTMFNKDDEIKVETALKNLRGESLVIAYNFLFTAEIPTAIGFPASTEMPPKPYTREFQKDEIIRQFNDLGGLFETGVHEIKYKAIFYINLGESNEETIEIWSNTVTITIN